MTKYSQKKNLEFQEKSPLPVKTKQQGMGENKKTVNVLADY